MRLASVATFQQPQLIDRFDARSSTEYPHQYIREVPVFPSPQPPAPTEAEPYLDFGPPKANMEPNREDRVRQIYFENQVSLVDPLRGGGTMMLEEFVRLVTSLFRHTPRPPRGETRSGLTKRDSRPLSPSWMKLAQRTHTQQNSPTTTAGSIVVTISRMSTLLTLALRS